jgi:hypothetical protein
MVGGLQRSDEVSKRKNLGVDMGSRVLEPVEAVGKPAHVVFADGSTDTACFKQDVLPPTALAWVSS